ncbi:hypothetical protein KFK09_023209 [Dendrobium nobile]|uniref:Uncharacterized protein n=1 Tax=Dendrobium nobile TaxID=94219 RepID=A0A8T3AKW0_DENNO|nr:hypothetical protein KFK09_023209 [Dendrobium nobile]
MGGSSRPINALEMADFWNVLWSDFWTGSSRPILDRPGTIRYDKNPERIVLRNRPGPIGFVLIGQDD